MKIFYFSLMILVTIYSSLLVAMDQDCDLTGTTLQRFSELSQDICWQKCQSSSTCQGAVFISNWNNCHHLSKIKNRHKIRMYSEFGSQSGYRLDFTGKDLKMVAMANKESCRSTCQNEKLCQGFTYIEGYRSCWLKKSSGKLISKIFYCKKKEALYGP